MKTTDSLMLSQDDELLLEGPELEQAISKLDSNGWNTSGYVSRTTWLRVWVQHCRIREDILEIAQVPLQSSNDQE